MDCPHCGKPLSKGGRLDSYLHQVGGSLVELIDSVARFRCVKGCAAEAIEIPNLVGLIAAVALSRAMQPMKLTPAEIRFLRKTIGLQSKALADSLNVSAEAVSRWESGAQTMSPQAEKVLRIVAVSILGPRAPAIDVDVNTVLGLKLTPCRDGSNGVEPMRFELVRLKDRDKKEPHWDTTEELAAA